MCSPWTGGHPSKYWSSAKLVPELGNRLAPDTYRLPNAVGYRKKYFLKLKKLSKALKTFWVNAINYLLIVIFLMNCKLSIPVITGSIANTNLLQIFVEHIYHKCLLLFAINFLSFKFIVFSFSRLLVERFRLNFYRTYSWPCTINWVKNRDTSFYLL